MNYMEGEGEQQHQPSYMNTTNIVPYPTPTNNNQYLPQLDQEPLPLDIDWVTLLNGSANPGCSSLGPGKSGDAGGSSSRSSKGRVCGGGKSKKSRVTPRVAFHTTSVEDVLDDGYKWRKYGQKSVKNSLHPRSYYRCTYHTCNVKKQIQRLSKDTSVVVTTYEGVHNHPSEKLMETLAPLLKQLQFLGRF
uniref:WRKY transcription factor n=1 Tax=Fagopyrum tataricum TaxID=62330 RepID=A0A4P9Q2B0_FAGTA|nr:WRKY transcription factor [Fagopyrum tataricum]